MAQKRMFDKAIIDTDKFMDMPVSAKALYFLLGMEADDEGFVSYRKVIRVHGGTNDDIKVLQAKEFVIMFESGVIVITDWKKNNYLDKKRVKETEYQEEKKLLALQNGKYKMFNGCLTDVKPEERRGEENRAEEKRREEKNIAKNTFSQGIAQVIEKFKEISPSLSYGNKTQRRAAQEMIERFGLDETLRMVEVVLEAQKNDRYAPRATTPYAMWTKIGDFKNYFGNKKSDNSISIGII